MKDPIKQANPQPVDPEMFEATCQALGLLLKSVAQQMNEPALLEDLRKRTQSARIVGINPLAIRLLESASGILSANRPQRD
jgi:hypothetical protein